ncbi:MAG: hypothetical protein QOF35_2345 [Actinomycetota bacterium]|jgi:hypothetical protein|nr:hypothetical protein [Actinomycetota bacterium]
MKKSMIAVAAVGVALSGASMVPAQGSPAHLAVNGPAHANLQLCANPPAVDTLTSLDLRKTTVHRGDTNTATVHVTSAGAVDPTGLVSLAIYQSQSGSGYQKAINDGVVRFAMPTNLSVGKYMVRASYDPTQCSKWRMSRSSILHLTVLHAN